MVIFGPNQKLYINQQVIVYSVFKVKSFSRLNRKIQESCQNEKQGKEFFLTPIYSNQNGLLGNISWAKYHSMFSTVHFALPPLLFPENFQWKNFSVKSEDKSN